MISKVMNRHAKLALCLFAAFLALLFCINADVYADYEDTTGHFNFTVDSSGYATITGGNSAVIPATISDGYHSYPVKYIGDRAFCYLSDLTGNLTIPNSVTTIGAGAFSGCSGLTGNLTIGNNVTTIGASAFEGCSGLTGNLTIPNGVTTIGLSAFSGCSGLTGNLTIPNSVTTIGASAFYGCSGLTGNLTIPNSVTTIGEQAFCNCSGLTGNLTIPNSVTTIGAFAFSGCSGLTGNLTIGNSVTEIGWCAFCYCSGLTGNLTIPNSVTTIGDIAFSGCSGLTGNLTIGNSVTEIGLCAFYGCSGLKSVYFQGDAPDIADYAFNRCELYGYYPADNETWTADKLQDYGGRIIWNYSPVHITTASGAEVTTFTDINGSIFNYVETGSAGGTIHGNISNIEEPWFYIVFDDEMFSEESADSEEGISIGLPCGFSFEFDKDEYTREFSIQQLKDNNNIIKIYPNYLPGTCPETLDFSFKGLVEATYQVPVVLDPYNGVVYCRASQVEQNVSLLPVEDLVQASPDSYNGRLSWMGNTLSQSAYEEGYIIESLHNLGFSFVETYGYDNSESEGIACAIGQRAILAENGELQRCVAVIVRGTYALAGEYVEEWIGNFLVYTPDGASGVHSDFNKCKDVIAKYINQYINECVSIGCPIQASDTNLFITGYSRAAAVVDLYAHECTSKWNKLFAYTFATPNSTQTPAEDSNIFNIVNYDDVVGFVPAGNEWGKYGKTMVVGSPDDKVTVPSICLAVYWGDSANNLASRPFLARKIGTWIGNLDPDRANNNPVGKNHGADMYLSFDLAGEFPYVTFETALNYYRAQNNEILFGALKQFIEKGTTYWDNGGKEHIFTMIKDLQFTNALENIFMPGNPATYLEEYVLENVTRFFEIDCPVNVTISTFDGKKVAEFKNHELTYYDDKYGVAFTEGEGSYALLTGIEGGYVADIYAYEDGTMSIYQDAINYSSGDYANYSTSNYPITVGRHYEITSPNGMDFSASEITELQSSVLKLPDALTTIDYEAFSGINAETIIIPRGCQYIASDAFDNCPNLEYIINYSNVDISIESEGKTVTVISPNKQ